METFVKYGSLTYFETPKTIFYVVYLYKCKKSFVGF